jgi:alkylation response protein AidB-like acyl-CoA dehydrogenase
LDRRPPILPRIAAGECYFCIGMSEPDTGSDLASVRTRAVREGDRYIVNGTKVWTSHAQFSHYMILFCRTGAAEG